MPLQVVMEEGPRSKAVHFSGLQYRHYSQEKISLITLRSNHVILGRTGSLKIKDVERSDASPV